jgi:hypothetical protein
MVSVIDKFSTHLSSGVAIPESWGHPIFRKSRYFFSN